MDAKRRDPLGRLLLAAVLAAALWVPGLELTAGTVAECSTAGENGWGETTREIDRDYVIREEGWEALRGEDTRIRR